MDTSILKTDWKNLDDQDFLVLFNSLMIQVNGIFVSHIVNFQQERIKKLTDVQGIEMADITTIVQEFTIECAKRGFYGDYLKQALNYTRTLH